MEFNSNGVIEPGLHNYTVESFINDFVACFPASQTRAQVFGALVKFVREVSEKCSPVEIWLDGSFITTKLNPNDIDIVMFILVDDMETLFGDGGATFQNLRDDNPLVDAYASFAVCEENMCRLNPRESNEVINKRNYWKGQFGFDRNDGPKGIIVMQWGQLRDYLNGGDGNADVI